MFRSMLCSLVIVGVCGGVTFADNPKDKTVKVGKEAKITKLDAKKATVTAKVQSDGKEVEKTFKLAEDIAYMDSTGKVANIEIFTSGDLVLIVETEGVITQMKKCKSDTAKTPASK
jgi:hypothetical protein